MSGYALYKNGLRSTPVYWQATGSMTRNQRTVSVRQERQDYARSRRMTGALVRHKVLLKTAGLCVVALALAYARARLSVCMSSIS